jgi:hypothetical protein
MVVSSLEEICNRLKLRQRKLLRTKVRGKARIVGKTTKRLQQMRLQKGRERILSQIEDQQRRNAESLTGNNRRQEKIQIAAGKRKREKERETYLEQDNLFEWIMNQTSLVYLHRNTGPKQFHDSKKLHHLHRKTGPKVFHDAKRRKNSNDDGETKSNTEETNITSKLSLILAFLSFCDSMHDFNDTRSLIKYHLDIPQNSQIVQGFLFCRDKIKTVQNFSSSASFLLLRNHFETMLFNYMYDKFPLLVEDITNNSHHDKKFQYYCTETSHERIKRLFKNHGTAVQFDQLFDPFNFYARDIAAVKTTVMNNIKKSNKSWERVIHMMHYWDAMKSSGLTNITQNETFSFVNTFPNTIIDPRHSIFCIKNKKQKTNKNVTLDIGCDENNDNDVHITNQKSKPVNTVSNLSYIIGIIRKHGLNKVFGENQLTHLESELAFYPTSTVQEVSHFFEKKKVVREKCFKALYDPQTSLGQLYLNLKDIYNSISDSNAYSRIHEKNNRSLEDKYISLLLDMKRTGDWGQASWVYNNNKIHENSKTKKIVVFESGDKLSALYSIYLNNPTIFGGGLGNFTDSSFGFYNPYYTQMGGVCALKKGGGEKEVIELLNPYAQVSDKLEFISHVVDIPALTDFLGKNIVSFEEVATQIFKASNKTLPQDIYNKLRESKTIAQKNRIVYEACKKWLDTNSDEQDKNLEMFELTNFIELTMSSILSSDIQKELSFLSNGKDSFKGWFTTIVYPTKFYFLRTKPKTFYTNEAKLVKLWINTYQHMYPSQKFEENI